MIDVEKIMTIQNIFQMQRDPTKKALYERKVINRDGTKNFLPVELGMQKVCLGLS